jgi:hypothetical protein
VVRCARRARERRCRSRVALGHRGARGGDPELCRTADARNGSVRTSTTSAKRSPGITLQHRRRELGWLPDHAHHEGRLREP